MTVATLEATNTENRKAVVAGTIGNVLEWYDFGVYGYLATTMSQLFFPGDDKTVSLLKAFANIPGLGRPRPDLGKLARLTVDLKSIATHPPLQTATAEC